MKTKATIDIGRKGLESAFLESAKDGDAGRVRALLEDGADVHALYGCALCPAVGGRMGGEISGNRIVRSVEYGGSI